MLNEIGTTEHVLEVCDHALAMEGYKVLEGGDEHIFIKHNGKYFEVRVIDCTDTL